MAATIGRLTGTEDRVVLCTLDGAVTRLRCFHSTQRMVDGVEVANHSEPNDYDGRRSRTSSQPTPSVGRRNVAALLVPSGRA